MKKIVFCLIVGVMLCLSSSNIFGQNVYRKDFSIENAGRAYQLESNSISVFVNNLNKYDVFAIEPSFVSTRNKSKEVVLKSWEISYKQGNIGDMPISISKLDNIIATQNNANFAKGVLTVNALPDNENSRSVLHLALPRGVSVKLYVDGNLLYNASLDGQGLMVQNGKSINSIKGYSTEAALSQAVIVRENRPLPTSYKTVDWQTLSSLVVKRTESPTLFDSKGESWAFVQLDVDETGMVRNVLYSGGNEALANASKELLNNYKFRPFLVNDKPIRVKSVVPITIVKGQIKVFSDGK